MTQARTPVERSARGVVRALGCGVAGTAAMTATTALEQAARRSRRGPVDYDASPHVVTAASAVLRHTPNTLRGRRALFLLVHWGYGSAVALGYPALRTQTRSDPAAAAGFYLGCQTMAMTLFPTLGGTPPPWRWRRGIVLTSLVQHGVYVITVALAHRWAERHAADTLSAARPRPCATSPARPESRR